MLNWTMSAVYGLKPGEVILFKCHLNILKLVLKTTIFLCFHFILGVVGSFWFRLGSWSFLHLLRASSSWESYSVVWGKCEWVLSTWTFLQWVQCGIREFCFSLKFLFSACQNYGILTQYVRLGLFYYWLIVQM